MEKSYKTKQRARILEYLKDNKDKHITADTIIEHFKSTGNPIGKATVYRYLDRYRYNGFIRVSKGGFTVIYLILLELPGGYLNKNIKY